MADVSEQDLIHMKRLFHACAVQFRRYAATETSKLDGHLSIVERQQTEQSIDMNNKFAAACDVYADDQPAEPATQE